MGRTFPFGGEPGKVCNPTHRRHPTSGRTGCAVHQSETWTTRRGLVRELGHGRHNPAPGSYSVVIARERQLVSASSALLECVVAIALAHELRHPLNVDLGYQSAKLIKSPPGPPMSLGNAAASRVRLIVWCKTCRHRVEPDPAEQAERYGAETPVPEWCRRLVCSACAGRDIDMVVSGI